MVRHEVTAYIPKNEFTRISRLLAIKSLEVLTDDELIKLGANTDCCEGVLSVKFDNGSVINFDLCSGQHNYWDDVTWISADGTRVVTLDCEYELGDIEVEIDSEIYIVYITTSEVKELDKTR